MVRKPDSDRLNKLLGKPSLEKQEEIRAKVKEQAAPEDDGWETFLDSNDCSTPNTLFGRPPEKMIAKLSYGDLVYCWLLEDNEDYLCYLCNTAWFWTTVYIFKGVSQRQRNMIHSVYGLNNVDWRVVPITARNSNTEFSRNDGGDWSVWIFCHYFNFDSFPEPR
jgi:hypothetical protein